MSLYQHPDGSFTMYPINKTAAKKAGKLRYDTQVTCDICYMATIKFVENDECVGCQNLKAQIASELIHKPHLGNYKGDTYQFYDRVVQLSQEWQDEIAMIVLLVQAGAAHGPVESCPKGHVGLKEMGTGACYECANKPISPRQDAINAGLKWYTPTTSCKACNTTALRRVDNGKCKGCQTVARPVKPLSARQQAVRDGAKWYTPATQCKTCLTAAPRRVNNGECSGCAGDGSRR